MDPFLAKVRARPIGDKYSLVHKLGEGGFGNVYLARDVNTKDEVALKLEYVNNEPLFLKEEYEQYSKFGNLVGFPKVYWYGEHDDFKAMAMELLGPSLEELLVYCGGQFTLRTTLLIADQLLERLEVLHTRKLIHRDIKPENFLLGTGRSGNTIYLTDLGLIWPYRGRRVSKQYDRTERLSLIGTAYYASINGHRGRGIAQSPYDDLESLGYMLIYLLRGELPWHHVRASNSDEKSRIILEKKIDLDIEKLCAGLPRAFADLMLEARSAPEEVPDYSELRNAFRKAAQAGRIEYDQVYDWTLRSYLEKHLAVRDDGKKVDGA